MAEQAVAAGLTAVPVVTNHYRKIWDPIQRRMKGDSNRDDPDVHDHRTMEDKGYVLRKRSEVRPGEEVVDTVRHRGEVKDRRPGGRPRADRRSSSMGDARDSYGSRAAYGAAGAGAGAAAAGYESEGSVPPRSRTRARSYGTRSRRGSSSSSTSSSDLGSSTDEEKQVRKMQRKKWITAALASVATIHAASKVYSSIEEHDKRIIQVQKGELSPEEAHKKQRNARWQDAAAIGIAALGIKGALSEWNEVQEEHKEHKELMEKREEHHKKRMEKARRERAKQAGGYYKARDGNWYYDGPERQHSERQLEGPRNGERKLLEGPSRSRARSAYDDDRSYDQNGDGRSRSRYTDDRRRSTRSRYDDDY